MTDQIIVESLTGKGSWKIANFPTAHYYIIPGNVSQKLTYTKPRAVATANF